MTVAMRGNYAADIAVVRAQPGVFGLVASDPTVSRLVATLAPDAVAALEAIASGPADCRVVGLAPVRRDATQLQRARSSMIME